MLPNDESIGENAIEPSTIPETAVDESENLENSDNEDSQDLDPQSNEEGEGVDEPEEEEPVIQFDEFDCGGNKLQIAKGKLSDEEVEKLQKYTKGLWSARTKDAQAIAEERKTLAAKIDLAEKKLAAKLDLADKLHNLSAEVQKDYAKGLQLKNELEQLEQLDLEELYKSDPDSYRYYSDLKSKKSSEFQKTIQALSEKELSANQHRTAFIMQSHEEGKNKILKSIPDFKPDEVINYVMSKGVKKEECETWGVNPLSAEFAYKAMMYDRIQEKMKTATKPEVKKANPVKTVASKGSGNNTKDPTKMSMQEYAAWWNSVNKKN